MCAKYLSIEYYMRGYALRLQYTCIYKQKLGVMVYRVVSMVEIHVYTSKLQPHNVLCCIYSLVTGSIYYHSTTLRRVA